MFDEMTTLSLIIILSVVLLPLHLSLLKRLNVLERRINSIQGDTWRIEDKIDKTDRFRSL
mgnify:FL=1